MLRRYKFKCSSWIRFYQQGRGQIPIVSRSYCSFACEGRVASPEHALQSLTDCYSAILLPDLALVRQILDLSDSGTFNKE